MFSLSYGYTNDWMSSTPYKLMLLCEVALGEMRELHETEYITELKAPYKSVKAVGSSGPKPGKKIVLPNGCTVPIGKIVNHSEKDPEKPFCVSESEYIVYDVTQVRMRYLVQIKWNPISEISLSVPKYMSTQEKLKK